jgi:hypothetical protein
MTSVVVTPTPKITAFGLVSDISSTHGQKDVANGAIRFETPASTPARVVPVTGVTLSRVARLARHRVLSADLLSIVASRWPVR